MLQADHFRSKRRWFGSDIADDTAKKRSEFEFSVNAGETDDGKQVAPLALMLVSCCSAMGDIKAR